MKNRKTKAIICIFILLFGIFGQSTALAMPQKIKTRFTKLTNSFGSNLEFFLKNEDFEHDLNTGDYRVQFYFDGRELLKEKTYPQNIIVEISVLKDGEKSLLNLLTRTVKNQKAARNVLLNATLPRIEEDSQLVFDVYDTHGLIYESFVQNVTVTNPNLTADIDITETPNFNCASDDGKCLLEYFFKNVSISANYDKRLKTEVYKNDKGKYFINVPIKQSRKLGQKVKKFKINKPGSGGDISAFGSYPITHEGVEVGLISWDPSKDAIVMNYSNGTQNFAFKEDGSLELKNFILEETTLSDNPVPGQIEFDGSNIYLTTDQGRTLIGAQGPAGPAGPVGPQGPAGSGGGGGADDLGNHTANQDLMMAGFNILNGNQINGNLALLNNAVVGGSTDHTPYGSLTVSFQNDDNGGIVVRGSSTQTNKLPILRLYGDPAFGTPTADGFRLTIRNGITTGPFEDFVTFEKTDGNDNRPDGGFVFANTGNDGIMDIPFIIRGNNDIGVNRINPRADFDINGSLLVNGSFQYKDGNQAANFILSSDAGGNGSWTTINSILNGTAASSDGIAGAIQFSDGNNGFASDASALFWDNTAKDLRINAASSYGSDLYIASNGGFGTRTQMEIITHNGFAEHLIGDESGNRKWGIGSFGDNRPDGTGGKNNFFIYQYTDNGDAVVNKSRLFINDQGNIGIGKGFTRPRASLDVNGSFFVNGSIQYLDGNQANNYVLTSNASGVATWVDPTTLPANGDNLGNHTATNNLDMATFDILDAGLINGTTAQLTTSIGVNITGAPSAALEVNGFALIGDSSRNVIALGSFSADNNTGSHVNNIGYSAGRYNNGSHSTFIGSHAGLYNNGDFVNAVGRYAARLNNGDYLSAFGEQAGYYNDGDFVTALGFYAGRLNNGHNLVAIGRSAATYNSGNAVIAIGRVAASENSGNGSIAIGRSTLSSNNGHNNIALGNFAGDALNNGDFNILIGNGAQAIDNNGDNQLNIGNTIYGDLNNGEIALGSATTNPQATLDLTGSFRYIDGFEANGYVLTSNGGGFATWKPSGSGADNLGNHTATENLDMASFDILNAGQINGTDIDLSNRLSINYPDAPSAVLEVNGWALIGNKTNYVVALGQDAASSMVNASQQVNALGHQAAMNNNGNSINALGTQAAFNNIGTHVNAFGNSAAVANKGSNINALGDDAAAGNNGDNVNAIGFWAARTSVGDNVNAFGFYAARDSIGSDLNVMGSTAAWENNGSHLNAFGGSAGFDNDGDYVNAIGAAAASYNTGDHVNAIGANTAQNNSGNGSIAIGRKALYDSNGDYNIAIGYEAGELLNNGAFNILIGNGVEAIDNNGNYQLNIANTIYGDLNNGEIALGSATTNPQATLDLTGSFRYIDGNEANGYVLTSNGGGFATWQPASSGASSHGINGAVQFSDGSGGFNSDATNFFWDDTNNHLGIGSTAPGGELQVNGHSLLGRNLTRNGTALGLNTANTNTGLRVVAIGDASASGNNGDYLVAIGYNTGSLNSGDQVITLGQNTGMNNLGDYSFIAGQNAGRDNNGNNLFAVGTNAGRSNTGIHSSFIGSSAGHNNNGDYSIAIGNLAGYRNNGNYTIALGLEAAEFNDGIHGNYLGFEAGGSNIGDYVNALGYQSARDNTANNLNAFGQRAAMRNIGGQVNALGYEAARYNNGNYINALGFASARHNIGINLNTMGHYAAEENNGSYANLFGPYAGQYNRGDQANVLGGYSAIYNRGHHLSLVGYQAARYNTGDHVIAMGNSSVDNNSGDGVIALGRETLMNANGDYNIAIGYRTGSVLNSGARNILIGYDIEAQDNNGSYELNIGNTIYGDLNNGEIALGRANANPAATLDLNGSLLVNGSFQYLDGNQTNGYVLTSNGGGVATWQSINSLINGTAASSNGIVGAIQFSDGNNGFNSNDTNLFWDDTNKRVGINVAAPVQDLHVNGSAIIGNFTDKTTFIGRDAGNSNTGERVNAIGYRAATLNTRNGVNAFGDEAAANNTGDHLNAFGEEAGILNNGDYVNAIGHLAAYFNNGDNVQAMGLSAARYNNGDYAIAVGGSAGFFNNGDNAVLFGLNAGYHNNGANVFAAGAYAGGNNTGASSVLIGNAAGQHNTGAGLLALGVSSGRNNLGSNVLSFGALTAHYNEGDYVTALNHSAANDNNGDHLFAAGRNAAYHNTGNYVTAIGYSSAYHNKGGYLTAIGYDSALNNDGLGVIAIGRDSLEVNNGDYNIAIGDQAGMSMNNGNGNILIGHAVEAIDNNGDFDLNIGNTIYGDMSNGEIILGKASTDPQATLEVNGTLLVNGTTTFDGVFVNEYSTNNTSGAAVTVNWNTSNKQEITMGHNVTFTFTDPPGLASLTLFLIQDGTGSRLATWPSNVKWSGGVAPTLTTTANFMDIINCVFRSGNYYCSATVDFDPS